MNPEEKFFEYYSLVCNTISSPLRLRIIETIGKRQINVSELQKILGVSMSNLSNNLGTLYKIGIVDRKKEGNYIYYYLSHIEILDVIGNMKKIVQLITKKRSKFLTLIEMQNNKN